MRGKASKKRGAQGAKKSQLTTPDYIGEEYRFGAVEETTLISKREKNW